MHLHCAWLGTMIMSTMSFPFHFTTNLPNQTSHNRGWVRPPRLLAGTIVQTIVHTGGNTVNNRKTRKSTWKHIYLWKHVIYRCKLLTLPPSSCNPSMDTTRSRLLASKLLASNFKHHVAEVGQPDFVKRFGEQISSILLRAHSADLHVCFAA